MNTRIRARGGRLRYAVAAACLAMTGTAYAATTPAAQDSTTGGVTMSGKQGKVRYGARLVLSGRVESVGKPVRLEHAPRGRGWRPLAQSSTTKDGAYRFRVTARQSGSYRAVSNGGATSPSRRITVKAKVGARSSKHVQRGGSARVRGAVRPGLGGRTVAVQVAQGGRWKTVDRARTGRGGRFNARWKPAAQGTFKVRVRFGGDSSNSAAAKRLARLRVYRPGVASYYGPGLYGNRTACGQTLTPGIVGVANKTLPCGTKVTFRYRGRSVTTRVIDRGPFHASREWDLTNGLKQKLGFGSTGTVWSTR